MAGGAVLAFVLDLRDGAGALLLPLTAAQILWINLITDGLPALALAFDRTPGVMQQAPRPPQSPLLDRPSVRFVIGAGTLKALLALGLLGLVPRLGYDLDAARATAFHFMAIGQLLFTYPARHTWTHPLPNRYLHGRGAPRHRHSAGGRRVAGDVAAAGAGVGARGALGAGVRRGRAGVGAGRSDRASGVAGTNPVTRQFG